MGEGGIGTDLEAGRETALEPPLKTAASRGPAGETQPQKPPQKDVRHTASEQEQLAKENGGIDACHAFCQGAVHTAQNAIEKQRTLLGKLPRKPEFFQRAADAFHSRRPVVPRQSLEWEKARAGTFSHLQDLWVGLDPLPPLSDGLEDSVLRKLRSQFIESTGYMPTDVYDFDRGKWRGLNQVGQNTMNAAFQRYLLAEGARSVLIKQVSKPEEPPEEEQIKGWGEVFVGLAGLVATKSEEARGVLQQELRNISTPAQTKPVASIPTP